MLQTEAERAPRTSPSTRWIFIGLFGLGLGLVVLLYTLPRPVALKLLDERALMEMVSHGVYLLGMLCLVLMLRHRPALAAWGIAALLFLSISEYNPGGLLTKWVDVPPPPDTGKPTGVNVNGVIALSLILLGILGGLYLSSGRAFLRGVQNKRAESWLVLIGAVFLPISFLIDRVQGYYFNWDRGYRMNKGLLYASDVVEETLEFLMPFFFFFAILLWSRRRKPPEATS